MEGESSSEGISPVDMRLVSIEDELKTISYSSAMAARDSQALRARVDELEKGFDIDSTLSKVYDHIETQDDRIEQVFDRLQVLERRLLEIGQRLDNLGEIGRLENLPGLLEQTLVASLDDLEARFESRLSQIETEGKGGAAPEEMLAVRQEVESKNRELRLQLEKLLEKRQDETVELIENAIRNLRLEDFKETNVRELDHLRSAVADLQESTEFLPTREDLERLESVAAATAGGASSEETQALASQLHETQAEFSAIKEQLGSIKQLFSGGDDWATRLQQGLESMQESASLVEGHQERVDLALRLVTQLEEKSRGLSFGGSDLGSDRDLSPPEGEVQLKLTLRDLVREMVKNRVSDLHIKTGRAITARIGKELIQFSTPPLTPADSFHLIASALRPSHRRRLVEERDIEFVYQYESVRLRANVFFDRSNLSATFKMLSNRPPELENLGLPKALSGLLGRPSGLILICGLPGSGRTTTLTAALDFLNRTRQLHLVSLEDRLDYTHEDRRSLVTQRELGTDIVSLAQGMNRAIGQDADVIFVSDLADRLTMEATFSAVESGLLVVGAITAQSAEDAIPRLINLFPETERKMRARIFAGALQGVLALKLFERADGEGQVPASELLVANATVKRLIEDANLSALHTQIAKGGAEGMQTFGQSIERLVETGLIRAEDATRELERLGELAAPRIGAIPATSKPVTAINPTSPVRPSAEGPVAEGAGQQSPPEAFGEEDTLMNWL